MVHSCLLYSGQSMGCPTLPGARSLLSECELRSHLLPPHCLAFPASLLVRAALTFAVCDVGGTIKISAGVAWTGDAMVLAKLRLIGAHGTADAPVGGGIVVVARRAVHCGGHVGGVLMVKGRGAPVRSRPSTPKDLSDLSHHHGSVSTSCMPHGEGEEELAGLCFSH